jgi:hypothetical protein
VFSWFRRKKSGALPPAVAKLPRDIRALLEVQRAYWRYDPVEADGFRERDRASLSWSELLRLHHLACMDLWQHTCTETKDEETIDPARRPAGALCRELAQRLLSPESPYRARHCDVWQGEPGTTSQRESDLRGELRNASLTHLGALEVLRLDQTRLPGEFRPVGLAFIPLDDIRAVLLSRPVLFRVGKIIYDTDHAPEVVLVPLIYAFSWDSNDELDHNGRMTRFTGFVEVDGAGRKQSLGLGVGQQDLQLQAAEGEQLFGLGSVAQISVALEMTDPRFDQKCRARGLDPDEVRRRIGPTTTNGKH